MSGSEFLELSINISLAILTLAFVLTLVRILIGPTLPDRVLALDMIVTVGIGYIAVITMKTGFSLYLDIAISLGLVGFLSTVAFARFIHQRGKAHRKRAENAEATS